MKCFNPMRRVLLALFVLAGSAGLAGAAQAAGALASGSLYQSDVTLTDQNGRAFHLADLRGQPVLISMFYSSCQMVCPMIFETIHATLAKGGKPAQDGVRVVMITVDPERDTPAALTSSASATGTTATSTSGRSGAGATS